MPDTKRKTKRYLHIVGVTVKADFAKENGMDYRYKLEIKKENASSQPRTVCAIMQNPSYAGEKEADKSVQFLEKNIFELNLPEFKDVERLVIVNQFARIQTTGFLGVGTDIGLRNNEAIISAIQKAEIIVIAWGTSNRFEDRKRFVLDHIDKEATKIRYKTRMHPSRGRYDGFIQAFDA